MEGKKFIVLFTGAVVITSIGIGIWIKQGYDTRPNIKIETEKK